MKATFKNSILMLTHVRSKPKDRLTWHQTLYDGHLTGSGSRWQKKQEFTEKIQHQGTHKLFPVHGVVNSANQKPVWGVTSDRTNPNKPSSEEAFSQSTTTDEQQQTTSSIIKFAFPTLRDSLFTENQIFSLSNSLDTFFLHSVSLSLVGGVNRSWRFSPSMVFFWLSLTERPDKA